jgi:hypothetical protein
MNLSSAKTMRRPMHCSRSPFQLVFVMESIQDRGRRNALADRKTMAVRLLRMPLGRWNRNTRSQAGVRPSAIVMGDPLTKNAAQLSFVQRDHEV